MFLYWFLDTPIASPSVEFDFFSIPKKTNRKKSNRAISEISNIIADPVFFFVKLLFYRVWILKKNSHVLQRRKK